MKSRTLHTGSLPYLRTSSQKKSTKKFQKKRSDTLSKEEIDAVTHVEDWIQTRLESKRFF